MKKSKNYHGRAIYQPNGKAGEYCSWATNLYNGCPNGCEYCYNNHSLMSATLGGTNVRLKSSLVDKKTAYQIFSTELLKWREQIISDGGLHFNFVSDPCLPETIVLNWMCITFALEQGVPVQVLTKRADWLNHPAVQDGLGYKSLIKVGFSLTGCDELEPGASPNSERVRAMQTLHDAGIETWASIEPIINPQRSFEMVEQTIMFCDHYKIGILSGKKEYTPLDIRQFVAAVESLNPHSVYWKESLTNYIII